MFWGSIVYLKMGSAYRSAKPNDTLNTCRSTGGRMSRDVGILNHSVNVHVPNIHTNKNVDEWGMFKERPPLSLYIVNKLTEIFMCNYNRDKTQEKSTPQNICLIEKPVDTLLLLKIIFYRHPIQNMISSKLNARV